MNICRVVSCGGVVHEGTNFCFNHLNPPMPEMNTHNDTEMSWHEWLARTVTEWDINAKYLVKSNTMFCGYYFANETSVKTHMKKTQWIEVRHTLGLITKQEGDELMGGVCAGKDCDNIVGNWNGVCSNTCYANRNEGDELMFVTDDEIEPCGVKIFTDDAPVHDPVNNPKHYDLFADGTQSMDVIQAALSPEEFKGFLKGNCLKYRLRAGKKDKLQQDIDKANWYENKLSEVIHGK